VYIINNIHPTIQNMKNMENIKIPNCLLESIILNLLYISIIIYFILNAIIF
jgi:hypothetical protein